MSKPFVWIEARSACRFAGSVFGALIALVAVGACRQQPDRPPDFALEYYHYPIPQGGPTTWIEVRIRSVQPVGPSAVAASGQGEITAVTTSPVGGQTKRSEPFTIDAGGLDQLHRKLAAAGLFRTAWRKSPEGPPAGSGSEFVEVRAGGRDYQVSSYPVPEQAEAARTILDTVWEAVPPDSKARLGVESLQSQEGLYPRPTPNPIDPGPRARLLGTHRLSLQWISWDYFGQATVAERNGTLYLKGEQTSRDSSDFVRIDGIITALEDKSFTFTGTIVTQVSRLNAGRPCARQGKMTFAARDTRKYWRLQQMQSPCGVETDYVDIYFR